MTIQIQEMTERHLPSIVTLLNEEYSNSHEFIPFSEERIKSQIKKRDLEVLAAVEHEKVLGLIATHLEGNREKHVSWLAPDQNQDPTGNMLVKAAENRSNVDAISTMLDEDSPKIKNWIDRGYELRPGYQRMSAKLNGHAHTQKVDGNITLRNLGPDEEDKLVAMINKGFGWPRLETGVIEKWKTEDPPFNEEWVQVAEIENNIVSAVVAKPDTEYTKYRKLKQGYLGPAATLPEFRNKHLASALTARTMNFLFRNGFKTARLGTSEQNVSSIALLKSLGFHVEIVRKILWKKLK